ncbi:MAG: L-threonylcarbamoyladenylate synthase [Acidimicrobiales bacterium]
MVSTAGVSGAPVGRAEVVAALLAGDVVLIPTDTVYGLAVIPTIPGATQKLFDHKGRDRTVPIAVLVADADQAWSVAARPVSASALGLASRFWPGALTIVVDRDPAWPGDIGDGPSTVGLRCPDHDMVRGLCRDVGPLATTSANAHGKATPATVAEALAQVGPVALAVDVGPLGGAPSTVVDCTGPTLRVLRQGAVAVSRSTP